MRPARVLIVDDSIVIRRLLADFLSSDTEIEVVGSAFDSNVALKKIECCSPDLILLDIEMPGTDGLTLLTEIKKRYPKMIVIMCSALTEAGGSIVLDALSRGADDYITKPSSTSSFEEMKDKFSENLRSKIKALTWKIEKNSSIVSVPTISSSNNRYFESNIKILAIGTSTGGPNALIELIKALPKDLPVPVLIVQHMPPLFTRLLADRLTSLGKIPVYESVGNEKITPGKAWLAPGDYHLEIESVGSDVVTKLNQAPQENSCRPSVDVLFRSVVNIYGSNTLGVIMTGMGQDGLIGCEWIHRAGGTIFAQDEASSVVWGMPGAVVRAGIASRVLSLSDLSRVIVDRINVFSLGK